MISEKVIVDIIAKRLTLKMSACKYKIFMMNIQLFVPVTRTFLESQQIRQCGGVRGDEE